jgi:hypothetical protein
MKGFIATRDFLLGVDSNDSITIKKGTFIEVQGKRLKLRNQFYDVPSIQACINKEWLVPGKRGAEVVDEEAPKAKTDKRVINTSIPKKWESLHWIKKLNFIKSCYSKDVLETLMKKATDKLAVHITNQMKMIDSNPETARDPEDLSLQTFPTNEDVPIEGLTLD